MQAILRLAAMAVLAFVVTTLVLVFATDGRPAGNPRKVTQAHIGDGSLLRAIQASRREANGCRSRVELPAHPVSFHAERSRSIEFRKWVLRRWASRSKQCRELNDWRAYLLRLVGPQVYRGCALPLIGRESGGVVTKWNYAGSGAYGLGQALPASKMARYGRDYMTNGITQIRWMHDYVDRFGGWCAANSFQLAHGWY